MSIRLRNRLLVMMSSVLAVSLLATGTMMALRFDSESTESSVREIVVVAEAMDFSFENPLRVLPGETVDFRLINRDAGMLHDFAIPELGVATPQISLGEEVVLRVTFPLTASVREYGYLCTVHPVTMTGMIEVGF